MADIDNNKISQDKRNLLGRKLFENFIKELFTYNLVQTDAHGANFIVTEELDRLYLIDFGACLEYGDDALSFYRAFLRHGYNGEKEKFLETFFNFWDRAGKTVEIDSELLWQYVELTCEPLHSNDYHWGETKLPDRAYPLAQKLFKTMKYKSAPSEFMFIDRKLIGLFSLLRKLDCHFDVKEAFEAIAMIDEKEE